MTDDLRHRLEAVERAVTGGETEFEHAADVAAVDARLTAVEDRLNEVESRLADLDAATQAVRGYLRGVDGLTEDVERQASLALAKAEAVEAHVFDAETGLTVRTQRGQPGETVTYVRDGGMAALDIDEDGTSDEIGRASRIDFSVRTVILVAVPPGKTGVGDTDGQAVEDSPGWGSSGGDEPHYVASG